MENGRCFVIQPFDGKRFDKRYTDVFAPAIRNADLVPYRVDRDPSSSIPIEDIERGIRDSALCFADVTLDNPNVWFELGYALASSKEVCIVCANERDSRFPFDIQHRSIIKYNTESSSDFELLENKITERLKAIEVKDENISKLAQSPIKETGDLSAIEIAMLCCVAQLSMVQGDTVSAWRVNDELRKMGYNELAAFVGVEKLAEKNFLQVDVGSDINGEEFKAITMKPIGKRWLIENTDRLELKKPKTSDDFDDEVPF